MSVSKELVWLVNQLRNAAQPRERLRLLALGWRTLKDLSPTERLRVARELGFDGAERLVEELSRRGGMSPSKLLGLLREAESADPNRLRAMVTGLMDPDGRTEIVDRLADEAADLLSDDGVIDTDEVTDAMREVLLPESVARDAAGIPLPPTPTTDPGSRSIEPPGTGPTLAASLAAAALDAKEVAREFREEHGAGVHPEAPRTELPVIVEDDGDGEDKAPPADTGAGDPDATLAGVDAPADPGFEDRGLKTVTEEQPSGAEAERIDRPSEPTPVHRPERQDIEGVLSTLVAETSLIRRLHALGESLAGLVDLGVDDMRRLMDVFPPGWARRRALETVLRAGLPRSLESAVAMVDVLEESGLRLWALTALAASRCLDEDDKEALLAAAGSKLVERRLRLRLS